MESSTTSASMKLPFWRSSTPAPIRTLTDCFASQQRKADGRDYEGHATRSARRRDSDFVFLCVLFDVHVLELAGLEDLAALFAFDEFAVFLAAHDLHARVLAGLLDFYAWAGRLRLGGHKIRNYPVERVKAEGGFRQNFRYCRTA